MQIREDRLSVIDPLYNWIFKLRGSAHETSSNLFERCYYQEIGKSGPEDSLVLVLYGFFPTNRSVSRGMDRTIHCTRLCLPKEHTQDEYIFLT